MRGGKQAFTLIELMIVVVIIAVLMTVAFKLAGLGTDTRCRDLTIERVQKLENALSGYYAAYGSYPPVPTQGINPNFRVQVNEYGVQQEDQIDGDGTALKWEQVEAVCRAQYIGAIYPYPQSMSTYIGQLSEIMRNLAGSEPGYAKFVNGFINASDLPGGIFDVPIEGSSSPYQGTNVRNSPRWNDCQLFRFGLLSFLLPRYLFMMSGAPEFYGTGSSDPPYAQWSSFNSLPCRVDNGERYQSWKSMHDYLFDSNGKRKQDSSGGTLIENLPSQRVTARWMPNLEKLIEGGDKFYGVDTAWGEGVAALRANNTGIPLYSSPGGRCYVLGQMTVRDGWGHELYYYSAPPYQSYMLWSAGPDGKTFPPWISLDSLGKDNATTAGGWMADDIIIMSH